MERALPASVRGVIGLFPIAWALHDLEELLTMGPWSRQAPERIRDRFPWIPRAVAEASRTTTREAATAIGMVGTVVIGASVQALRSGSPESGLFLPALSAYTAHGFTHLGMSAAFRRYTPGVITGAVVVLPYSFWAWTRLHQAGLADRRRAVRATALGAALAVPVTIGAHGLARLLMGRTLPAAAPGG
jgi:hypothetical protein